VDVRAQVAGDRIYRLILFFNSNGEGWKHDNHLQEKPGRTPDF
jgi:hypothetical protein